MGHNDLIVIVIILLGILKSQPIERCVRPIKVRSGVTCFFVTVYQISNNTLIPDIVRVSGENGDLLKLQLYHRVVLRPSD